tara:strand:- start:4764 stop:5927 length:1164 start_codon:yes stop_codon:yes gene_type:complete
MFHLHQLSGQVDTSLHPSFLEGVLQDGILFAWERQSEGSSLTLFIPNAPMDSFIEPTREQQWNAIVDWGEHLPGRVIRATRIWVANNDEEAERAVSAAGIGPDEMVSCTIAHRARLWSDFRIHTNGYGSLVIAANGTDPRDLSRSLQRLQELGNYRNRALLGLPIAQENWSKLNEIETRLQEISNHLSDPEQTDDSLLTEISEIQGRLTAVATATNFRMSATAAYATLVEERLEELAPGAIEGHASLVDFTQRRFRPAIRTCAALSSRIESLSARAGQITSLLRTRVETRIENQNGQLLRSMESSARRQLRLQELIENFSILALSYYAVGLLHYILNGVTSLSEETRDHATAALVPIVLLVIWLSVKTVKHRFVDRLDQPIARMPME